jgi:hypothetical protein
VHCEIIHWLLSTARSTCRSEAPQIVLSRKCYSIEGFVATQSIVCLNASNNAEEFTIRS